MSEEKKKSARRENREAALQFLYMWEINPHEVFTFALSDFFENQAHPRDYYSFAEVLVCGVVDHKAAIDETIQKYTQNWAFSRIAKVDLAILRLALYELFHCLDIPPVVSINEAVDLSKEFSHEDSKRFINGILDKVRADLKRPSRKPANDDA